MFVQFSVDNFRSIKDEIKISLMPAAIEKGDRNLFNVPNRDYKLLRSAVIYGANASGKTNILKAMGFMRSIVLNRKKVMQSTDTLPHEPFRLNTETENASSKFEIVFFIENVKYRYGFEIDETTVYAEWLYADQKGKESKLFYRDSDGDEYVNKTKFSEGNMFYVKDSDNAKILIPNNQLFLWRCDQFDGVIAKKILRWFSNFNFIDGLNHDRYVDYTFKKMKDKLFRRKMIELLRSADFDIQDVNLEESELSHDEIAVLPIPDSLKEEILNDGGLKTVEVNTSHNKYNEKLERVGSELFDLDKDESKGTEKFFKISAPLLNTLEYGKVLLIDELDASLHPMLTAHLISLFNDKEINVNNAQFIFVTHDTNLLCKEIFRRDQIWLAEKDQYGSTTVSSLAQFTSVRKQEAFERQYLFGKYGAVPYIRRFEF
jgi:AAA15 family ATPase/GTPase